MATPHFSIIGAGIAGLTSALVLKNLGLSYTIYESSSEAKAVGAGITLGINALRILKRMGIIEEIKAAGAVITRAELRKINGHLLSFTSLAQWSHPDPEMFVAISRHKLHQILVRQVGAENIKYYKKIKNFNINNFSSAGKMASEIELQFTDESSIKTKHVLAADGIHSIFRKKLVPYSAERYAGYTCWRGLVQMPQIPIEATCTIEFWGRGQRFGVVPIGGDFIYWFAVQNYSQNDRSRFALNKEQIVQMFKDGTHPMIAQILQSTPAESYLQNDIIDFPPIFEYAHGPILLLGDAAHAMTPNLGQGAGQCIEDAWRLGQCLQNNEVQNIPQAFKNFQENRVLRVKKIVDQSYHLGKIAQLQNPILCWLRDKALSGATKQQQQTLDFLLNINLD